MGEYKEGPDDAILVRYFLCKTGVAVGVNQGEAEDPKI